ncbi:MAG: 1-acyl-sn-glycerol-3-phosphate acyltransferase [Bacteroidales bacterium]|nr:1-acyl-sn-glycerol-3-phosphate acyltransferase [Bacteroidales bacterium]
MKQSFCKFMLKLLGWKAMDPPASEPKCIILGVPHTSAWDFIISWFYYNGVGGKASVMVKKEFFWGPLGPIVRWMGGIPVDRKKATGLVKQIIDAFNNSERMHLAIAPEGTRQKTANWKPGFHLIARACNIPVYLGYYDWAKKEVGIGQKIELTDDFKSDIKRIRAHYKQMGVVGKHPELFTTGDDLD